VKTSVLKDHPARPVGAAVPPWDNYYSEHRIEAKGNGWRGWFDQKEGIGYNRHGQIASNQRLMQERLTNCGIKSRWIDCELMGMRERVGLGTILIIDCFDPANPKPLAERAKEFAHIEQASFALPQNKLLRMPVIEHDKCAEAWEEMNQHNRGGLLWEGFVMKKDDRYPAIQDPSYCSLEWHKWRIL